MLIRMADRTRTTVTLPDDLLAYARTAAGDDDLSDYIEQLLRVQQLSDVATALRDWRDSAPDEDASAAGTAAEPYSSAELPSRRSKAKGRRS
jgi:cell wall assembly regulator SMI1